LCARLGLLAALGAFACDGDASRVAAGSDSVLFERDTPRYRLAVERPADAAVLRARVEPRGDFHLSTEFPSRLELSGTGVELATTQFARDDASALSEERVAFTVPYSGAGAASRVAGALTFGLCEGEELCERITERFDLALD